MNLITLVLTSIFIILGTTTGYSEDSENRMNLTNGVIPVISLTKGGGFFEGGELFDKGTLTSRGTTHYRISVRNQTDDPIESSTLIVVVDKIMELARGRNVLNEVELVGVNGVTDAGKPYIRIPEGDSLELGPYSESKSVEIKILNPDLFRLAPPTLQVWGVRKTETKKIKELGQVLIQKGILTQEEADQLLEPSRLTSQP